MPDCLTSTVICVRTIQCSGPPPSPIPPPPCPPSRLLLLPLLPNRHILCPLLLRRPFASTLCNLHMLQSIVLVFINHLIVWIRSSQILNRRNPPWIIRCKRRTLEPLTQNLVACSHACGIVNRVENVALCLEELVEAWERERHLEGSRRPRGVGGGWVRGGRKEGGGVAPLLAASRRRRRRRRWREWCPGGRGGLEYRLRRGFCGLGGEEEFRAKTCAKADARLSLFFARRRLSLGRGMCFCAWKFTSTIILVVSRRVSAFTFDGE